MSHSKDITTTISGTVVEVGAIDSTDPQLPNGAFVRLARNSGVDVLICGLTDDEARAIAGAHFFEAASITVTRAP